MGDGNGPSPAGLSEATARTVRSLVSVSAFRGLTAVPRLISQQPVRFLCEYVSLKRSSERDVPPRALTPRCCLCSRSPMPTPSCYNSCCPRSALCSAVIYLKDLSRAQTFSAPSPRPCTTSERNRRGPHRRVLRARNTALPPGLSAARALLRSESRRDEAEHGPVPTAPGSSAPLGPLLPATKFCASACFHLLRNEAMLAILTNIPRAGNRSDEI